MTILRITDLGKTGINRDQWETTDDWTDAINVRFMEGSASRFDGEAMVHGTASVSPNAVFFSNTVDGPYTCYASQAALYACTGTTHTNITRQDVSGTAIAYTGSITDKWVAATHDGWTVLTNNKDVPQAWAGGTNIAISLTAWPSSTTCKVIRSFKNYLIAGNITKSGVNYPHLLKWSDISDPGTLPATWDINDTTADAGEVDVASTQDKIVEMRQLGDEMFIYKERSVYGMLYAGNPFVFNIRTVTTAFGCLATNCVGVFPGGHIVLTQGDLVTFDGINATSIASGRMWNWLFNNIDSDYYDNCFIVTNERKSEAWVCFPSLGNSLCNKALIWNWSYNTLTLRDIPSCSHGASGILGYEIGKSWADDSDPWSDDTTVWDEYQFNKNAPKTILATPSSKTLWMVDYGNKMNGSSITASVIRGGMTFGVPEKRKLMKSLRPRIEATNGTVVNVYVGKQSDLIGPIDWKGPWAFTVGSTVQIVPNVLGRYLAVKFEGSAQWKLRNVEMDVAEEGWW